MMIFKRKTLAVLLGALLSTGAAFADLSSDAIPPTEEQVQRAPADAPEVTGFRTLEVEGIAEQTDLMAVAKALEERIRTELAAHEGVVVVSSIDTAPPEAATERHAKNFVTHAPAPERIIKLKVGPLISGGGVFGADHHMVEVTVVDKANSAIGGDEFEYAPTKAEESIAPILAYVMAELQLPSETEQPAAAPTAGDPAPGIERPAAAVKPQGDSRPALPAPKLESWMETEDGKDPHIGSKIAFYFRASEKGYVSLYHFGSSGTVNRIFPTESAKANFVEAGKLYRYPAGERFLKAEGPAGSELVKAIFTVWPSNTPRVLESGLKLKSDPIQIIPTHYPVLFADAQLTGATRFFGLPHHLYAESHIEYELGEAESK